jgi:hypothetical protein
MKSHLTPAEFTDTLAAFRDLVHRWSRSEEKPQPDFHIAVRRRQGRNLHRQVAWSLAGVTACALVGLIVMSAPHAPSGPSSDAQVLNQIDSELARDIPCSMQPLMTLVSRPPATE